MNPIQKVFCRVYQLVLRAALPLLPYREPELYDGVEELRPALDARGVRSVLLVTDAQLRRAGVTARLEQLLDQWGVACAVYDRTCPNPTVRNVEEARTMYVERGCQGLIAVGGGSSMDCAKAVGARIAYPNRSLGQLKGILRVLRRIPPLIAVPTTAGTGSEATLAAVITDPDKSHKYTINSFPLIPACAVLDPEMTRTLPPSLTATTGMDALTHAVEVCVGRSTTRQTRAWALEAARLVFENIETAYHHGDDRVARAGMLRAAFLAGEAFSQSYVGYIHAVAHSLGGQYNVPHGLANSVLMPIVLEYYGAAVHRPLRDMAVAVGVAAPEESDRAAAERFIGAIRALNRRMGIPETLPGIREEDIPRMARHAAREANPLYPVPVLMSAQELKSFYYKVADWGETRRQDGGASK